MTLGVRIPYLPVAGRPLVMTERCVKTMPALRAAPATTTPDPATTTDAGPEPTKETAK
ncbi:hypothetical protein [Actinomadura sp. J1-007]|uniref:hypothetical protein n=1 Tax=Actinomadura sp. J1-007 TaxID=2661913 RepID=UPI0019D62DD8|nr:hypothetical protein [Actinomadura sp. J1-007]